MDHSSQSTGKVTAADGHTYYKSATSNAKTAPTNDLTIAGAAKTKDLTPSQAELVTVLDYEWSLGRELSREYLIEEYGYTMSELAMLDEPAVIQAASERGVNMASFTPRSELPKSKLSPLQLVVANTMLDLSDTRSNSKKLKDAGITTYKYNNWLKDPEFLGYIRQRAEDMIGSDLQHEAMLALADKVMARDLKAIEYYHEITGRFVRQNSSNSNSSNHDVSQMIVRIIEIIVDEVDDPATASRISERLKGLVMGNQVAQALTSPALPTVAPVREVSPEIQTLMNKGVGYDS